jgi:hypothetical protein
MATVTTSTLALKEWAVCEAALLRGDTIVLLRKGGIREPTRAFRIEHEAFALFPTYEHQRADLLVPAARPLLANAMADRPAADQVRVRLWLHVTDAFEVTDPGHLAGLAGQHIWTGDYAVERLRWRPRQPLIVMLTRAWRLVEPLWLPLEPRYGGCSSWVQLAAAPDLNGSVRVLDDAAYAARVSAAGAVLEGLPRVRPAAHQS